MVTKPKQHEIDRAGKRLLRQILEPLNFIVNDVQEDYGIDCNVQVFVDTTPTGAWFHVQLKSSASSEYSANGSFVSQQLSVGHARYYALELREPIFLIHADITSGCLYWHAPQLDRHLATVLNNTQAQFIAVRIPVGQKLPETALELLRSLDDIYLLLGNRELTAASAESFAESLKHLPDQEALHRAFQEKNDTLRLQRILTLFHEKRFSEARGRADALVLDPDSTIEIKFWAQMTINSINFTETVHSGKPQSELPKVVLADAKTLQKLTRRGPKHLKFYSLISRRAAELYLLTQQDITFSMGLKAHLESHGNPFLAIGLLARRSENTRRIVSKYNQCVRLARYAAGYQDRWMLGRALSEIPRSLGLYLVSLRAEEKLEVEKKFSESALQILKLAVWICRETGDSTGLVLSITSALSLTSSTDSAAYAWANEVAKNIVDKNTHDDALRAITRAEKRWAGEAVEGDYHGETVWQLIQNIASGLGLDLSDEANPFVRGLKIAARDDSPERILAHCEHLLVTQGAIGPIARSIQQLFNTSRACSKVVHCTLHNFHVEGKEQDIAYGEFRRAHCDSCPDQKPQPEGWRYTEEIRQAFEAGNLGFLNSLIGTPFQPRFTDED